MLRLCILIGAFYLVSAQDYCKVCTNHTMCIYSGVGTKCGNSTFGGVNETSQKQILQLNNELRSRVANGQETRGSPGPQPKSTNMKVLTWSDELATIARRWADQCDYGHDKCRNTTTYNWVGQNVAIRSYSPCTSLDTLPDWNNSTLSWYNEVVDFDSGIVPKFRTTTKKTGHYTQIVWGNTEKIGCAFRAWKNGTWCSKYYVCNYGTGGNVIGQPVY